MAERPTAGQVLRASDPEPPTGSRVRDDCGLTWVNDGYRPCCWVRPDLVVEGVHDPESWTKVAGNYGPVTVLEWGEPVQVWRRVDGGKRRLVGAEEEQR